MQTNLLVGAWCRFHITNEDPNQHAGHVISVSNQPGMPGNNVQISVTHGPNANRVITVHEAMLTHVALTAESTEALAKAPEAEVRKMKEDQEEANRKRQLDEKAKEQKAG